MKNYLVKYRTVKQVYIDKNYLKEYYNKVSKDYNLNLIIRENEILDVQKLINTSGYIFGIQNRKNDRQPKKSYCGTVTNFKRNAE